MAFISLTSVGLIAELSYMNFQDMPVSRLEPVKFCVTRKAETSKPTTFVRTLLIERRFLYEWKVFVPSASKENCAAKPGQDGGAG